MIAVDLADPAGPRKLVAEVPAVDVLVNNAGFADWGPFADAPEAKLDEMIELNVGALTRLTRAYLPGMLERGRGRVLNLASTAAFQPGPLMAVYYATKAYVLSLSEALAEETRGSGVTVTALCPGPTGERIPGRRRDGGQPPREGTQAPERGERRGLRREGDAARRRRRRPRPHEQGDGRVGALLTASGDPARRAPDAGREVTSRLRRLEVGDHRGPALGIRAVRRVERAAVDDARVAPLRARRRSRRARRPPRTR